MAEKSTETIKYKTRKSLNCKLLEVGRVFQGSITVSFAYNFPGHLLLASIGDRVLSQTDLWSDSVVLQFYGSMRET